MKHVAKNAHDEVIPQYSNGVDDQSSDRVTFNVIILQAARCSVPCRGA